MKAPLPRGVIKLYLRWTFIKIRKCFFYTSDVGTTLIFNDLSFISVRTGIQFKFGNAKLVNVLSICKEIQKRIVDFYHIREVSLIKLITVNDIQHKPIEQVKPLLLIESLLP